MFELDSTLAQHIVDRAMAILPHNINVMDAQGMIIGSGDPSRLHTRHEGAQLVLANRRVVEIDEQAAACLRETEDVNRAKEPGYELFIKGALLRFLALLIAQGKNLPPMETADSRRLKKILQWVADHYGEEVHISDAAQLVPCSESHFMRWFRQMTGQSFIAFLKEYRLNAAAEALHTTDDTVLSIASRCGFENLSYFNRAFKAHFGLTPREHRKK